MEDESDETSSIDDNCELKTKKNPYLSNLKEKIKALQIKNKQLQKEVKTLKHKRLITLENSNSVIKRLIDMNKTVNYLFVITI